jgi:hypothetical protein
MRPDTGSITRILAVEAELSGLVAQRDAAWEALIDEERASLWLPGAPAPGGADCHRGY